MTAAFQRIPVPGYSGPTGTFVDTEILYSTVGYTQKGVTLAGGQGILPAGTVLGQRTADKLYYVYSNAASDGTQTAHGVLRRDVDTGTVGAPKPQLGNIVIAGILKANLVSGADSPALTDLGATVDVVRNTFKF